MSDVSYKDLYSASANHLPLGTALDLHYQFNPQFTRWNRYVTAEARSLVKAHDISHLIFGCDTGLLGEMQVQLWSKFAVQPMALRDTIRYARDKESRVLLKNPAGYLKMAIFFIKNFSEVKRVRTKCAAMSKNGSTLTKRNTSRRRWAIFARRTGLFCESCVTDID